MTKERISTFTKSFNDFEGKNRVVTIVTISSSGQYIDNEDKDVSYEMDVYTTDYGTDPVADFNKIVRIGFCICNPNDTYDKERGYNIALKRARTSVPILGVTDAIYVNEEVAQGIMKQQFKLISSNPDKFIKGYNKRKIKLQKEKETSEVMNSLNIDKNSFKETINKFGYTKVIETIKNIFKK